MPLKPFFARKSFFPAVQEEGGELLQGSGDGQTLSGHRFVGLHSSTCGRLLSGSRVLVWIPLRTPRIVPEPQGPPPTHLMMPKSSQVQWKKRDWAKRTADYKFIFCAWNKWKMSMDHTSSLELKSQMQPTEAHVVLNKQIHGWEPGPQSSLL